MIFIEHDPKTSWRDYQRIRFIKGFYKTRKLVVDLLNQFEKEQTIAHETIDSLLEFHLRALKDLSHVLYRMQDDQDVDRKKQRIFDKILGALWHELDKCRDNIRLLEAYTELETYTELEADPEQEDADSDKMMQRLNRLDTQVINAARRDLPFQFRRAKRIMDQLVPLFEQILPVYRDNEVVLRSLYFARDHFEEFCTLSAIEYFYPILYESVTEGYARLIRSLIRTRHYKQARVAWDEMNIWVKSRPKEMDIVQRVESEFGEILLKAAPNNNSNGGNSNGGNSNGGS